MIRRLSDEAGPARPLRLGVVGATGQVGGVVLRLLADRGLPLDELRLFASARSAGSTIEFQGVAGLPPRKNTQIPASTKSLEMSRSMASCVSVTPAAA